MICITFRARGANELPTVPRVEVHHFIHEEADHLKDVPHQARIPNRAMSACAAAEHEREHVRTFSGLLFVVVHAVVFPPTPKVARI